MTPLLRLFPLVVAAYGPLLAGAVPSADPCAKIAGMAFVPPADVLACYKSFPFNETLRQNVMTNMARVFDFFTFEDYYYDSPPPFQESTVDIRATVAKLSKQKFKTDYDFNKAVYDFTTQLNDGHTRYFPTCYTGFQNLLPAPVITLAVPNGIASGNGDQSVYIAPDAVEFIEQLGPVYLSYFDETVKFDWRRLAGAKVIEIEGLEPYEYVDKIASTISGNYLDHGIRVNSVFTSYRISGGTWGQRLGDLAGPSNVEQTTLKLKLIPVNSTKAETVKIPYLASYGGETFSDGPSYWKINCLADESTNGIDIRGEGNSGRLKKKQPKANIVDLSNIKAIGLPEPYQPTLPPVGAASDVIKSFILPGNKTGVIYVGSFSPLDYEKFQTVIVSAIDQFKAAGVTQLLIDLTNNGGGYVCLGHFLHQYLAGTQVGYPGFVSSMRGNALAQKIVAAHAALGDDDLELYYSPDNWAFLNGTGMPHGYDYYKPLEPFVVNGRPDPTSQRFHDTCESSFVPTMPRTPPFDLKKVAIVNNGNCASTCAMFSTLMSERHNTKIAVFGGKPGERMEYKGMAGNQVLEWSDLDTEIKSVGLKNDSLAPPDLLVNSNFRVNWRTAWSWLSPNEPIAYASEPAKYRFPYTIDTYNNPQNLWTFAASRLFA